MSGLSFPLLAADAATQPTITIDDAAWRLYKESIARNPPETVALLGGRLDAPTRITEFYFMPPPQRGGRFEHGAAHVALDAMAMNYIVDRVLVPNGKYMLGLWHSHPDRYDRPSEPDLRLCKAILNNDDSPGRRWPFFIAPITTFEADGSDRVTVWILRKGADAFEPASFAPPLPEPAPRFLQDAPHVVETPIDGAGAARPYPIVSDPLVADLVRLGSLLTQPDGLVGVPRHRAGFHLWKALRIAEDGAAGALQP